MTLDEVLEMLDKAGVRHGNRNKLVAEKTGYSLGTVTRILSGNAALTDRFIMAVRGAFGGVPAAYHSGKVELHGWHSKDDLIKILYEMSTQTPS